MRFYQNSCDGSRAIPRELTDMKKLTDNYCFPTPPFKHPPKKGPSKQTLATGVVSMYRSLNETE